MYNLHTYQVAITIQHENISKELLMHIKCLRNKSGCITKAHRQLQLYDVVICLHDFSFKYLFHLLSLDSLSVVSIIDKSMHKAYGIDEWVIVHMARPRMAWMRRLDYYYIFITKIVN